MQAPRPARSVFQGIVCLLLLLLSALPALAGELRVDVLDVGQGDSLLLTSPEGKTVLIDAGDGRRELLPELQARGVTQLDLVVSTHAHQDHIGGMEAVIRALPVGVFLDSGVPHTSQTYVDLMTAVEELGLAYMEAEAGQHIAFGEEASIDVLWPGRTKLHGTRSNLNANSVVLRLVHGGNCFLFTGDAEEETEVRLMVRGLEPCQVLKVPHHGSNHSSTDRFLSKTQPTMAIISVGEHNRYNHPGEEALRRLERHGATVYRTDTQGALRFISDGAAIHIMQDIVTVQPGAVPPPSVEAAAEPAPGAESDSYAAASAPRFVASAKSQVFHRPDCEWALKINPTNLEEYGSFKQAVEAGKRPAHCCNPIPEQDGEPGDVP